MSRKTSSDSSGGNEDTIAAVATPPGRGGIGVIRISGPRAIGIAETLCRRQFQARHATLSWFLAADGERLDQGLVLVFNGDGSFTGEPVAELHGHGGPMVLRRIMHAVLALGARIARPGEFSERAFLNGRMDLAQAEAVADLIASGSEAAARGAVQSLSGTFSRAVEALAEQLRALRVLVEAQIDFPDEELDLEDVLFSRSEFESLTRGVENLLGKARRGARLGQGATVAIVGPPNAGKSSLLNALSEDEVAIVTPIPGTTRDLLKVDLVIQGLPIRLIDTAGLRETEDPIEQEGIRRARQALQNADLVVEVEDLTCPPDQRLPGTWLEGVASTLRVGNKLDMAPGREALVNVSALTGAGIKQLEAAILERLEYQPDSSGFTARDRHVALLQAVSDHLNLAGTLTGQKVGSEFVAEELRLAHDALGEIVGRVSADMLLGDIFSTFCIGK